MIKRIVLTGGPGSGKTTVLKNIDSVFTSLGYKVIILDETATYLIEKGIRPFGEDPVDMVDFQELVMKLQLAKENVIDRATEMLKNKNIIIVYDRGSIDNSAYVNKEEFESVLNRLGNVTTIQELMDKYDLVINLVGGREFYTTLNNSARSEDVERALELGETTLKSWMGHKKIKIVLPKKQMEDKINEVLNIINDELKEKKVKRQEKYLVDLEKTDIDYIIKNGRHVTIEQTYLWSKEDEEKRLRKVTLNEKIAYYLSYFRILGNGRKEVISEKNIDEKIYNSLLEFKKEDTETIYKNRYYFNYEGEYFSLDVFDNMSSFGLLEINVDSSEKITIPPFVKVLEKVTDDERFLNRHIALEKGNTKKLVPEN